jgi:hypothetical protein
VLIAFGSLSAHAATMTVPIATVYENYLSPRTKDQIRRPWKIGAVKPITVTQVVDGASDGFFGL